MNENGEHTLEGYLGNFLETSITVSALSFAFFTLDRINDYSAWAVFTIFVVGTASLLTSVHALRTIVGIVNIPSFFRVLYKNWTASALLLALFILTIGFVAIGRGPLFESLGEISASIASGADDVSNFFRQESGVLESTTPGVGTSDQLVTPVQGE